MHLRHLLIRLLLLAVCFNTAIGKSAHEVWHLEQATAAVTAPSAPLADGSADPTEQGSEADGVCAWCLAHAGLGLLPAQLAVVQASAWQNDRPQPWAPETFVPNPGRWPFAARDPPAV